jgi:hypothetical protein
MILEVFCFQKEYCRDGWKKWKGGDAGAFWQSLEDRRIQSLEYPYFFRGPIRIETLKRAFVEYATPDEFPAIPIDELRKISLADLSKACRDDKETVLFWVSGAPARGGPAGKWDGDGRALQYASAALRDDRGVVAAAVKNDWQALRWAGKE